MYRVDMKDIMAERKEEKNNTKKNQEKNKVQTNNFPMECII